MTVVHSILLALIASSNVYAQQPTTAPSIPRTVFTLVLHREFPRWDANGDGTLSEIEIDRAVIDPSNTGESAAAAATLKIFVRSGKYALPDLNASYFDSYESAAARYRASRSRSRESSTQPATAPTTTPDDIAAVLEGASPATAPAQDASAIARPSPDWDLMFSACKRRIARTNAPNHGPVWPENGLSLRTIRQGPLGDCYLVSVVGAMVARDPKDVERLVEPLDDGTFRVSFPSAEPVVVGPLTDAQIAMSSSTAGEGLWLAVLEQAFGRHRSSVKPSTRDTSEATDAISRGGSTGPTISALTGRDRMRIALSSNPARRESRAAVLLPQIRKELVAAMRERRIVTTGVNPPTGSTTRATTRPVASLKVPPGIHTRHAYAVLSYDAESDTLVLWNPHGQTFRPNGEPGLSNGYPTDHGVFKLPLNDAYQFVASFTFETNDPAPQPSTRPTAR